MFSILFADLNVIFKILNNTVSNFYVRHCPRLLWNKINIFQENKNNQKHYYYNFYIVFIIAFIMLKFLTLINKRSNSISQKKLNNLKTFNLYIV